MSSHDTKAIEKMTRIELIDEVRRLRTDYDAADDEVRALKLKVRRLEMLGTQDEYDAYHAMKKRALAAEKALRR